MKKIIVHSYFHLQEYKLSKILLMIKSWKRAAKKRCRREKKGIAKEEGTRRDQEKSMCRCPICITNSTTKRSIKEKGVGSAKKSR